VVGKVDTIRWDKRDLILTMRFMLLSFGLFSMGQVIASADVLWGNSENGFSVGLAFSNTAYHLDKPIPVTVFVRNESAAVLSLPIAPLPFFWSFSATDDHRAMVKAKPQSDGDGSVISTMLSPNAVETATLDLRDYLYITNSGRYVITAKRLLGWPNFAFSGGAIIDILSDDQLNVSDQKAPAAPNALTAVDVHNLPNGTTSFGEQETLHLPISTARDGHGSGTDRDSPKSRTRIVIGIIAGLVVFVLSVVWRARMREGRGG
jgi:hypothetical protein